MLWELLRYPSEDPHAQVYWRRRLSVLAVAATLLLLMLMLVFRGGGNPQVQQASAEVPGPAAVPSAPAPSPGAAAPSVSPSPSATPTPSASASPTASASADAADDPASTCPAGSMALRVASDASTYAPEQQPVFTLSVVDVGNSPCTADLGTRYTSIDVLSQGKPVWTSNACVDKTSRSVQLTPATEQQMQLRWDLSRNATGCSAAAAKAAKGQYEIVARVGKQATYGGGFTLN